MKLVRNPSQGRLPFTAGCAVTIGAFDGLHLGHQQIIRRVVQTARERDLASMVFSFEPMPKEYFAPRVECSARLTKFREKFNLLKMQELDIFYCPRFGGGLELLNPRAFIDTVLVGMLDVRHIVVGDDFRFARGRAGDMADLDRGSREHGYSVEHVSSVFVNGERVSSTGVRSALAEGRLDDAREMLGRHYAITGRVVRGAGLGRELGFPTANVNLNRRQRPLSGIFAVRVNGIGQSKRDGVASVGTRPTVDGTHPLLEVFVFDYEGDLYGRQIQVEFVARLRDEVRFPDLDALRRQMETDAAQARDILHDSS
jgi:riboflavin kinase/FMN adenylyltransferase